MLPKKCGEIKRNKKIIHFNKIKRLYSIIAESMDKKLLLDLSFTTQFIENTLSAYICTSLLLNYASAHSISTIETSHLLLTNSLFQF